MIFQHTWQKVLDGSKTQTRRVWDHTSEGVFFSPTDGHNIETITRNWRRWHWVGQEIAVQPGRGKKSVGRIRITRMRLEDVRTIDVADVTAEGFASYHEFITLWCKMHGERYNALVIEFELVGVD